MLNNKETLLENISLNNAINEELKSKTKKELIEEILRLNGVITCLKELSDIYRETNISLKVNAELWKTRCWKAESVISDMVATGKRYEKNCR
ncbi:hypothetical protein ACV3UL_07670 [Clostridium perfringens]